MLMQMRRGLYKIVDGYLGNVEKTLRITESDGY